MLKRFWIAILLPVLAVACSKNAATSNDGSDLSSAMSETGAGGDISGTGTGAGGYGSGPTGTGGTAPADNQAVESNPDQ
jgi:hypothetical protein